MQQNYKPPSIVPVRIIAHFDLDSSRLLTSNLPLDFFSCAVPAQSEGISSFTMKVSIKSISDPVTEIAQVPSSNETILNVYVPCAPCPCLNFAYCRYLIEFLISALPTVQSAQQQGDRVEVTLSEQVTGVADPTRCSYQGALLSTFVCSTPPPAVLTSPADETEDCFVCVWTPSDGTTEFRTFASLSNTSATATCAIPPVGGDFNLEFRQNNCPLQSTEPIVAPKTTQITINANSESEDLQGESDLVGGGDEGGQTESKRIFCTRGDSAL